MEILELLSKEVILTVSSIVVTDNLYDFIILDDGKVLLEDSTKGYSSMLDLDFSSFSNWELDSRLGLDWANEDNTGILQYKNNNELVAAAIINKFAGADYIREVKKIVLETSKADRSGAVYSEVVFNNGQSVIVSNTVGG